MKRRAFPAAGATSLAWRATGAATAQPLAGLTLGTSGLRADD